MALIRRVFADYGDPAGRLAEAAYVYDDATNAVVALEIDEAPGHRVRLSVPTPGDIAQTFPPLDKRQPVARRTIPVGDKSLFLQNVAKAGQPAKLAFPAPLEVEWTIQPE